jgi:hypothetical protein
VPYVDVAAAMEEQPRSRAVSLKVVSARPAGAEAADDPYAGVEV